MAEAKDADVPMVSKESDDPTFCYMTELSNVDVSTTIKAKMASTIDSKNHTGNEVPNLTLSLPKKMDSDENLAAESENTTETTNGLDSKHENNDGLKPAPNSTNEDAAKSVPDSSELPDTVLVSDNQPTSNGDVHPKEKPSEPEATKKEEEETNIIETKASTELKDEENTDSKAIEDEKEKTEETPKEEEASATESPQKSQDATEPMEITQDDKAESSQTELTEDIKPSKPEFELNPEDLTTETIGKQFEAMSDKIDQFFEARDDQILKDLQEFIQNLGKLFETYGVTSSVASEGLSGKKGRGSKKVSTGRRKSGTQEAPSPPVKKEPPPPKEPEIPVNFEELEGLAVFAKWPNSGWYYPGIIKGIDSVTWKDLGSHTVHFYDGLVRDMKSVNILPAYMVPAGSVLCDLDDESEMTVDKTEKESENRIVYTMSSKSSPDEGLKVGFAKVAVRQVHMKQIRQLVQAADPNNEIKKVNMVSLDNLVSGTRVRGSWKRKTDQYSASPSVRDSDKGESDGEQSLEVGSGRSSSKRRSTSSQRTPNKRRNTPRK